MSSDKKLAENLLQIKAIKLSPKNPFTWASGWKSPIYCDNRLTLAYPKVRRSIIKAFVEICNDLPEFDVVVGVATAGIPHGALLADALNKPFAYVRSKPKEHGRQNQIEGRIEEGQRVIMVEDLISTGGSLIKAAKPLQDIGVKLVHALAIFTYGFPQSVKNLEEAGIPFSAITDYHELLEIALNLSYIGKDDVKTLKEWRKSPHTWNR